MSRYIDADALKKAFVKPVNDFVEGVSDHLEIGKIIDAQPTADVVEVVRCKDCKFQGHIQRCPFGKRAMPHANGYCYYGERREDE